MVRLVSDQSSKPFQTIFSWIIAIVTAGYMLPWAIAATRGKSNTGTIFWINLLLGWSIIGWIVALIMSLNSHQIVGIQE
ncbi:MAG: superinfection immunity protein [Actinomycetales bacterium]|nr:superinfection immunity protein [Actinomycetales bacterium]